VLVTQRGFETVTNHVARFGEYGPNQAMLSRLSSQIGSSATGADANFYEHELIESGLMESGMSYGEAHAAALSQAGVSPFSIYAPDVI
jgi:filamentous hemagglutinin